MYIYIYIYMRRGWWWCSLFTFNADVRECSNKQSKKAWSVLEAGGEFCYPASQSPIAGNCAAMRSAGKDRPKKSDGDAAIFAALVKAGGQRWYTGKCLNITAYE